MLASELFDPEFPKASLPAVEIWLKIKWRDDTCIVPSQADLQRRKKKAPKVDQLQNTLRATSHSFVERGIGKIVGRRGRVFCSYPGSVQQVKRHTATSWDISLNHNHSVITTYRRFFEAESANLSICRQNTSCSLITCHNHLPTSQMVALLPRKLQACWKRTALIRKYKFTPKTGSQNI